MDKKKCMKVHKAINLDGLYLPVELSEKKECISWTDLKYNDTCVYLCVCVCVCVCVSVCLYPYLFTLLPFHGIPPSLKSTLTC